MATNPNLGEFFDQNMGNIWVQPDGANTVMQRLACHDIDDIDEPFGDVTQKYCPDPTGPGKWKVVHITQAPPERVTTTFTVPVGKTSDYLERARGRFASYIMMSQGGDRRNPLAYDRAFRLANCLFSSKGKANLASREGTDQAEQSFGVSADPPLGNIFPLVLTPQTTAEAQNLMGIAAYGQDVPQGPLGPAQKLCTKMFATARSATAPTSANTIITANEGVTWAATAVDPFATPGGEHVSCVVAFPISRTIDRILVGRGLTDAGNPAEIAYSDDGGASWTLVNVGAVNGSFFSWTNSIFALDKAHIWAVTSAGDIFFSSDGGQSWTEQVTANANALHAVHFINENFGVVAGASNTVLKTEDGGLHWSTLAGPSGKSSVIIRSAQILDAYRIWLAYDDGDLYYTIQGGTAAAQWTRRTLPGVVTGIGALRFINDYDVAFCGYRTVSSSHFPLIGRSWNGGMDWELYQYGTAFASNPSTVTEGLNSLVFCDTNTIYAVGDVISGAATILVAAAA